MLDQANIQIRETTPQEDPLLAEHFYQMWLDIGVPARSIESNWRDITQKFLNRARQELSYKAFVAEVNAKVVASAGCQLYAGLHPNIITAEYWKKGYIWGVYVEPAYRCQGIGKQLMRSCIVYLKSIDCTQAILHASPQGKPVYVNLGFSDHNQMRLDLS